MPVYFCQQLCVERIFYAEQSQTLKKRHRVIHVMLVPRTRGRWWAQRFFSIDTAAAEWDGALLYRGQLDEQEVQCAVECSV